MVRYALTIFLSAFLLFQVQPLIAKYILPWFGGSPAVWTTCMLFFQMLLLAGYAYAHLASARLTPSRQVAVHVGLLALSLAFLPIIPDAVWKPSGDEQPTARILVLLAATIGIPYLLLSTTGPLLQRWFSRTSPGRSPYRLYALSNAGSLLALVSYPVVVEPFFEVQVQAVSWSLGYGLFAALCAWCGWRLLRSGENAPAGEAAMANDEQSMRTTASDLSAALPFSKGGPREVGSLATTQSPPAPPYQEGEPHDRTATPRPGDLATWLALAAVPSILLLATTNQMCQEVAVVPFLWVLPLSLYLLSFILCFDSERWYRRSLWAPVLAASTVAAFYCLVKGVSVPLTWQVAAFSAVLFAGCMACHGELAASKPDARHLTLFYLVIAAGGALGGLFVVLAAPRIFTTYYIELPLGMILAVVLTMIAWMRSRGVSVARGRRAWLSWTALAALAAVGVVQSKRLLDRTIGTVERTRNFYGILTVAKDEDSLGEYYQLNHGRIQHGSQYLAPEQRRWKTGYYGPESGVGVAIRFHPARTRTADGQDSLGESPIGSREEVSEKDTRDWGLPLHGKSADGPEKPFRIGVIGLGVGTIAAYGRAGDVVRFYEINPDVERLARKRFTYLSDCLGDVTVVMGDARVKLEQELAANAPQRFDVLAVDAFSSDAIPMHLLTRECFEVYFKHLKPDGILAVHISNRFLNLEPVVCSLAEQADCTALPVEWDPGNDEDESANERESASRWILVTRNRRFIESPEVQARIDDWDGDLPRLIWTDHYGSLLQVLRR